MARPLVLSLALVAVLTGCRNTTPLVSSSALDPGDECSNGGTAFATGVDADKDGVLTGDEIEETVVICNGAPGTDGSDGSDGKDGSDGADGADGNDGTGGQDGAAVVFRTTTLPVGDADCPGGGTRIEFGLDDGAGGETAGDGVLGDGEVQATQAICDGSPAIIPDAVDEPGGAAGTGTIDISGGDGADGDGGRGGDIDISTSDDNPANVKVFTTGAADASFTLPSFPVDLGLEPAVFSADATIPRAISVNVVSGLTDGEVFLSNEDNGLFVYDSGGSHSQVTGLHIQPGATVSIEAGGEVDFHVTSLVVEGTLATGFLGGGRDGVDLTGQLLHVGTSGIIDTSGDTFGAPGEQELYFSVVVMEGTLDASGDTDGQSGEQIDLYSDYGTYATGQLLARGADATNGSGGNGGTAYIGIEDIGPVFSSAYIDVRGGDGASGGEGGPGGEGGTAEIWCDNDCVVRSSGDIDAYGGFGEGLDGGEGGDVEIYGYGGSLVSTGDIDVRGGGSDGRDGGEGGFIDIYVGSDDREPGPIDVMGSFDLRGGDGDEGGRGGQVSVYHDSNLDGHFAPVTLYGYSQFVLDGGDGTDGEGGHAGGLEVHQGSYSDSQQQHGGVVFYVPVRGVSGSSETDTGKGGEVSLYCSDWEWDESCFVVSGATYTLGCGTGIHESSGGELDIEASGWVRHTGDVVLDAMDSSADSACWGGEINIEAGGTVTWSGDVSANGASTTASGGEGGYGGEIDVEASHVSWEGDLTLRGGDGPTDGTGSDGGYVWLRSALGGSTVTIGAADLTGGSGGDSGLDGWVYVDGFNVTAALPTP